MRGKLVRTAAVTMVILGFWEKLATLIAPAPVASKKIDLRKQVHNLVLGRVELTHINDLQAVVKKIVGKNGEKEQLLREQTLLLQIFRDPWHCWGEKCFDKSTHLVACGAIR